jgi:hypothetical protein
VVDAFVLAMCLCASQLRRNNLFPFLQNFNQKAYREETTWKILGKEGI